VTWTLDLVYIFLKLTSQRIASHQSHPILGMSPRSHQAQALLDEGFLEALVNLDKLSDYWSRFLLDYPQHPAAGNWERSLPITLYGA